MKIQVAVWGLLLMGTGACALPVWGAAQDKDVVVQPTATDMAEAVSAYLRGSIADLAGDPQAASKGYLNALAEDPDNLSLRERVLELTLMGGDIPTSIRLAKSLPEVEQNTMSRLVLAMDAAHEGKIKEARKIMRRAAKGAPGLLQFELLRSYLEFADGVKADKLVAGLEKLPVPASLAGRKLYHEARLWLKAGKPDKALEVLEKAQAREPNAIFTTLLLAQVEARQGAGDRVPGLLADFAAGNPTVGLIMPDGGELVAKGAPPFASTLDEDLAATMFDFALVVWSEGGLAPARQLMNLALWLAPDQPYYRYYSGILLEMGGDYAAAAQAYESLLDNPVLVRGAKLRLSEVYARMGDLDKAWQEIRGLLKEFPHEIAVHRSAGQLAFLREDYKRAASEYTWLLDQLPEDAEDKVRVELLFARGASYERGHIYDKAEADLRAVLALDPANAQVLNYLGYMWVDRNENLTEAFDMLKKAHLLAPDDGAVTDSLGWAYYRTGDFEAAVKYLEIAVQQDPGSAEIADHLGDAYAKVGQQMDARKYWRLALELLDKGGEAPSKDFREKVERKVR